MITTLILKTKPHNINIIEFIFTTKKYLTTLQIVNLIQ
jgi:hypothetical protein